MWDWGSNDETPLEAAPMVADPAGLSGVSPKLQTSWDWRAAVNFMAGGAGTGLLGITALATLFSAPLWSAVLMALALVVIGLLSVWFEIGRRWRVFNVFSHARLSWMTREAMVAPPFIVLSLLALITSWPILWLAAALSGLLFLYCQGRILLAARGIPAWRQTGIVALIVATGITEGLGLFAVFAILTGMDAHLIQMLIPTLLLMVLIRYLSWFNYRKSLGRAGAPTKTFVALDAGLLNLSFKTQLLTMMIVTTSFVLPAMLVPGGLLALVTGWSFKFTLITKAAYNQGYAIEQMPVRGAGDSAPGIKPGWTTS